MNGLPIAHDHPERPILMPTLTPMKRTYRPQRTATFLEQVVTGVLIGLTAIPPSALCGASANPSYSVADTSRLTRSGSAAAERAAEQDGAALPSASSVCARVPERKRPEQSGLVEPLLGGGRPGAHPEVLGRETVPNPLLPLPVGRGEGWGALPLN